MRWPVGRQRFLLAFMANFPPTLTAEERARAGLAAVAARRDRAGVKEQLRRGEISIFTAIIDSRESIRKMRVRELLLAVPGIGEKRVDILMERVGISPTRRIQGIGSAQLLRLRNELSVTKSDVRSGTLIVMSGPGGVGKSTITAHLRNHPAMWISVSATTREPRPGEVDGVDYFFVSHERFDQMINEGSFLEWAEFAGNRYGTPREPVEQWLSLGRHVLLEIEIAGARQVRASQPSALLLFIAPPSWEELVARLTARGTDSPERRAARLALAEEEMACAGEFDHTLVNRTVEEVSQSLLSLASAHQAGAVAN